MSASHGKPDTHTLDLNFLDDNPGEWVGGAWIPAATAADLEAERQYERLEREAIDRGEDDLP